jgi:peptidoglycan/LPS O-acetylase OafA/YrhL
MLFSPEGGKLAPNASRSGRAATSPSDDGDAADHKGSGQSALRHIPALDGARGAAVVAVILFHAGYLTGGYLGVDLFFVLSGFLITGLLLAERTKTGTIRLSSFWARRARRLLPALFLMLCGVAAFAAFVAAPSQLDKIRGDAFATVGYVANWREIFNGHDYWAIFSAPSPLNHTWSLAIEEQFYLLWPLAVLGLIMLPLRRLSLAARVLIVAIVGTVGLGGLAIALGYSGADNSRAYFGTDTRAPAILLGAGLAACVALWGTSRSKITRVVLEIAGLGALAWLAWAWIFLDGQDRFLLQGGLLASGVAAVVVLAAATHPSRGPIAVALSFAPLRWIGLISYGLYLWHWPVFVWLDQTRTHLSGWELAVVRVAVTLCVAIASYLLVEMPIRRGALAGWRIRVLTPAVVLATVALLVVSTAGAVAPPTVAAAIQHGKHLVPKGMPPPVVGSPKILVVGDSVAVYLGPSLNNLQTRMGVTTYAAGVPSCEVPRALNHRPPVGADVAARDAVTDPAVCADWPARWRDQLAQTQANYAMLVLGFPAVQDYQVNGAWLTPCTALWDRYYTSELTEALRTLQSTGARASVTTAAPPAAFYFAKSLTTQTECLNKDIRAAALITQSRVVDVASLVCPNHRCQQFINGNELRPDGFHYSGSGGDLIANWMVSQILPA